MECVDSNGGSRLVVTELSHIKELVKQLDVNLGGSPELCKHLAAQIFSVTERSIGMIKSGHFGKRSAAGAGLDSPPVSAAPSPLSGVSDMTFKPNKKRKTMERRKQQVRVMIPSGEGADTPSVVVDDGRSWRKYGQKEILGAKHPRGYYRCTHRKTQGCAATKQVQRSDEDPTLFDVIYHGEHTCLLHKTAGAKAQPEENPEPQNPEEALRLLQSLTVETEGLAAMAGPQSWSTTTTTTPFSFSSPPPPPPERYSMFSAPSTPDNCCFGRGVSSVELSPATSGGSSHLAMAAPFRAQSEMDKMVSALALVAAAGLPEPEVEADFSIDEFGLEDFDVSSFLA